MPESEDYIGRLLGGYSKQETPEQVILRACIEQIFRSKTEVDRISVAGDLIEYTRDHILSALGGVRRTAAFAAKGGMSSQQFAVVTGLSIATVNRLLTEYRNYE